MRTLTLSCRRLAPVLLLAALPLGAAGHGRAQARPDSTFRRFNVDITTSDRENAGTDASIYLVFSIKGAPRSSGAVVKLPHKGGDDERGKSTRCSIDAPPGVTLDNLVGLTLVNGMNGDRPGWHVAEVTIKGYTEQGSEYWVVQSQRLDRWLDTKEPAGPAAALELFTPARQFKDD